MKITREKIIELTNGNMVIKWDERFYSDRIQINVKNDTYRGDSLIIKINEIDALIETLKSMKETLKSDKII